MFGNKCGILDYFDLALFRLAKVGRKPLNEEAELDAFYEEFFTENDDRVFNSGRDRRKVYKGIVLDRLVRKHVCENGTVLDVGCGVGDNLKLVYGENIICKGLEYSAKSMSRARRILPDEVELQ